MAIKSDILKKKWQSKNIRVDLSHLESIWSNIHSKKPMIGKGEIHKNEEVWKYLNQTVQKNPMLNEFLKEVSEYDEEKFFELR